MTTRRPLIAGNWKMFKTGAEAVETAEKLSELVTGADHADVMIAPPYTALALVADAVKNGPVALGAQDIFWEDQGAYTGEISGAMLVAAGCHYVIIGHSERRQYFGETDDGVNKKIAAAIKHGLIPVMCIGETETQREDGQTFSVLDKQMQNGLHSFVFEHLNGLVVAYEPVWAIGTGKTATSEQAQEVHQHLRNWLAERFSPQQAESVRILYGGSVKPANIAELMSMADIDGALVGGASLDADTFSKIVRYE